MTRKANCKVCGWQVATPGRDTCEDPGQCKEQQEVNQAGAEALAAEIDRKILEDLGGLDAGHLWKRTRELSK